MIRMMFACVLALLLVGGCVVACNLVCAGVGLGSAFLL